jgi:HD-like signal output (HDOD) protein/signal transduction histidine kinase
VRKLNNRDPIREQLGSIELPRLPQILVQLIDICQSEEPDIHLVAQTVAQDVAVSTKTLQLANSAFLGARSQFKNIEQAVIFLGINTVRNLAISISLHGVFKNQVKKTGFNREEFWYHSLLTALISKAIAQKFNVEDPGTAYLTGLLHDAGKYILCHHFGKPYHDFMSANGQRLDIADAERREFSFSHCDVGRWLVESWNLSSEFAEAVANHHSSESDEQGPAKLDSVLRLANTLSISGTAEGTSAESDAEKLGIASESLASLAEEQREVLGDLADTLGIRIQEPQYSDQEETDNAYKEELRKKIETRAQLYGFMDNIIQATTMNRVFLALEESLALLFDCHKSFVLLPDDKKQSLIVQGSFRNQLARSLKAQNISIPHGSIWVEETEREGDSPPVRQPRILEEDEQFVPLFRQIQSKSLLALPLTISQGSYGAIVLGVPDTNTKIHNSQESLQLLCSHVGNRLHQEMLKQEYAESFAQERITAVEDMAKSIAHEISAPLSVIQNYISILSDNSKVKDLSEELSIINGEIKRIASISSQLSDLSASKKQVEAVKLDINTVIGESVALFKQSLGPDSEISLIHEAVENLPEVWMEANPLKQILGNLITNSIDALEDKGTIEVHCHHAPGSDENREGEIVIVVSDDGPGVAPSIVNSMFRAGKTTQPDGHAGLGLAIVSKLTKDIGGRIYHTSTSQGHTQFTLHFPVVKPPR